MSQQPPSSTPDAYVSEAEHRLLCEGLHRYLSLPEDGPDRNQILEELTQQLSALRSSWTCGTLRLWLTNSRRLFADLITPGDSPKILCNPNTQYASAIMDASFRLMMFDEAIALSFINSVLQEAKSQFPPIVHVSLTEIEARFREPGRPALDFYARTATGEEVIIEIKPRIETKFNRVAFSRMTAAWTRGGVWSEDVKDLYLIRIVDSGPWEGSDFTDCSFMAADDGTPMMETPVMGFIGVDVTLRRADVTFPVTDEVGRGWNAVQWWYYVLNFSEEFTDGEIDRCERLGMPAEVASGARKLKRSLWRREIEESYRNEVEGVDAVVERRLEPQLTELISAFMKKGQVVDGDLEKVSEKFTVDFVRRMWHIYGDRKDSEKYLAFLAVLRGLGLMNE
jgi:hypothetical protein